MNLRTRIAAGTTALAMLTPFSVVAFANAGTAAPAAALDAPIPTTVSVTGTIVGSSPANPEAFTGQLSDLSVTMLNGAPALTGTLTGTGLPATGTKISTLVNPVTAAAPNTSLAAPTATPEPNPTPAPTTTEAPLCRLLNLDVKNLRLDLLGLVILIPEAHLIIGGEARPGAVLGNLLCGVAEGPNPQTTISPTAVPTATPPASVPATPTATPPSPAALPPPARPPAPAALPPSITLG
jgi:hypothetical protein